MLQPSPNDAIPTISCKHDSFWSAFSSAEPKNPFLKVVEITMETTIRNDERKYYYNFVEK